MCSFALMSPPSTSFLLAIRRKTWLCVSRRARGLKEIPRCESLNMAGRGKRVAQLHGHVIARRLRDAAWPRPVWGVMPPLAHDAEEVQKFISALRRMIWLG